MKSKILNMNSTRYGIGKQAQNNKYVNYIAKTTIVPLTRNPFSNTAVSTAANTDYPLSNITSSYSTIKEARTTSVVSGLVNISGIEITMPALGGSGLLVGQEKLNTIFINVNKLNKTYLANFKDTNVYSYDRQYCYFVAFRLKATPTVITKVIEFTNERLEIDNNASNIQYFANLTEGNILIDSTLINHLFGVVELNAEDWIIDIGIRGPTINTSALQFSVSNIFIGNSVDFYVDEAMDYTKNNLNEWSNTKRVGKTFVQLNESEKAIKANFDLLTVEETNDMLNDWYLANKDAPLAFFPFCDIILDGSEVEWNLFNLEQGGLYFISKDLTVKNQKWNVNQIALELKEYK